MSEQEAFIGQYERTVLGGDAGAQRVCISRRLDLPSSEERSRGLSALTRDLRESKPLPSSEERSRGLSALTRDLRESKPCALVGGAISWTVGADKG